ncbi:hypothetical protein APX70_06083 [Pseudomonas syringae pv. maculicola]|nr:hypothetical protein APX70_06083 [Pseudomonas syringae pv. maculicola]
MFLLQISPTDVDALPMTVVSKAMPPSMIQVVVTSLPHPDLGDRSP